MNNALYRDEVRLECGGDENDQLKCTVYPSAIQHENKTHFTSVWGAIHAF